VYAANQQTNPANSQHTTTATATGRTKDSARVSHTCETRQSKVLQRRLRRTVGKSGQARSSHLRHRQRQESKRHKTQGHSQVAFPSAQFPIELPYNSDPISRRPSPSALKRSSVEPISPLPRCRPLAHYLAHGPRPWPRPWLHTRPSHSALTLGLALAFGLGLRLALYPKVKPKVRPNEATGKAKGEAKGKTKRGQM